MDNKVCFNISDEQKNELIKQLVSFALTDTLLYLPKEETVIAAVQILNNVLGSTYELSVGFDVSKQNMQQEPKLKQYLEQLSTKNISFIYLVGKELCSVFLAVMVFEQKISMKQAFELAFYEELKQQEKWGKLEEIIHRQNDVWQKLEQLDNLYDKRSIS